MSTCLSGNKKKLYACKPALYKEVWELRGYLNTGGLEGTGQETRRPSSVKSLLLNVVLGREMRFEY